MKLTHKVGDVHNVLTIRSYSRTDEYGRTYWNTSCSVCKGSHEVRSDGLHAKSECRKKRKVSPVAIAALLARNKSGTKHAKSKTMEYRAWKNMMGRCYCKTHPSYHLYGGRGITVIARWHVFENFYEDMGDMPVPGLTVDRINSKGHYEPGNCRWATWKVQNRNTTRNVHVTVGGETLILADWAVKFNITPGAMYKRAKRHGAEAAVKAALTGFASCLPSTPLASTPASMAVSP